MIDKNTDFPQFRKLSNSKTYYKIIDERNFEEKMVMGKNIMEFKVNATKYPEMLRIKEMLELEEPYILSSEEEFNSLFTGK